MAVASGCRQQYILWKDRGRALELLALPGTLALVCHLSDNIGHPQQGCLVTLSLFRLTLELWPTSGNMRDELGLVVLRAPTTSAGCTCAYKPFLSVSVCLSVSCLCVGCQGGSSGLWVPPEECLTGWGQARPAG